MEVTGWSTILTLLGFPILYSAIYTNAQGREIKTRVWTKGREGSSMILTCPDYDGGSTSTLGWYKGRSTYGDASLVNTDAIRHGRADQATAGQPRILSNGSLAFVNVTLMDERWYTCDFMTSNSVYLEVIVIPEESKISVGERPVIQGVEQDLHCTIQRVKPAESVAFVWYLNNMILQGATTQQQNADQTTRMTDVLIHTFNVSHQGQPIVCSMTFNRTFTLNTTHTLDVFVMPSEASISQPDVLVDDGSIQTVTCEVDRIKPHNASITWSLHNTPQKHDPGEMHVTARDDGTFTLINKFRHRFNMSDNGRRLWCTVTSGLQGVEPISTSTVLTVFEPGNATFIEVSGNPLRESNFSMMCSLVGTNQSVPSTAVYSWSRNGTELLQDTDTMLGLSSRSLTFSRLRSSDNGIYTCAIYTEKGWTMGAKNYSLISWYLPEVAAEGPRSVREGMNVTLTCTAEYYPRDKARVYWRLGDSTPVSGHWDEDHMHYAFPSIRGSDNGSYFCGVCNAVGCGWSQPISLDVLYAPQWAGGARYDASELGEAGKMLVCNVSANPAVQHFTWTYANGGKLRSGITASANTLYFDIVNNADYTNYTCRTSNVIDSVTNRAMFSIELKKKGPPHTPSDFSVLTNVTSRSISLGWKPGYDGSYPPQQFLIRYQAAGNESEKEEVMVGVTEDGGWMTHTLYNLTPSTNYTIWLRAQNRRPLNRGNNTSELLLQKTATTGIPNLAVRHLEVEAERITVFWTHAHAEGSQTSDHDHLCVRLVMEGEVMSECNVAASENQLAFRGQFRRDRAYTANIELYEGSLDTPSIASNRTSKPSVAGLVGEEESTYILLVVGAGTSLIALFILLLLIVFVRRRRAKRAKSDILRPKVGMVDRQSRRSSIYQYIDPDDVVETGDCCRPPAPPPPRAEGCCAAGEVAEPNVYSYSSLLRVQPNSKIPQGASSPDPKQDSDYLDPVRTKAVDDKQDGREPGYLQPTPLKSVPNERESDYLEPVSVGSNPTYGVRVVVPPASTGRRCDSAKASDTVRRADRTSQDKDAYNRPTSAVF